MSWTSKTSEILLLTQRHYEYNSDDIMNVTARAKYFIFISTMIRNTILNNDNDEAKILHSTTLILNYHTYASMYMCIMLKILFKEIGHDPLHGPRPLSSLLHVKYLILQIQRIHQRNYLIFFLPTRLLN